MMRPFGIFSAAGAAAARPLAVLALAVTLSGSLALACSRLTSPPEPEAVVTDTPPAPTPPAPKPSTAPPAPPPSASAAAPEPPLSVVDTKLGTGPAVKAGDKVKMHYTGTLTNGTEFDSSRGPNKKPFTFVLGKGQVIKGWDQGIGGVPEKGIAPMKVGGKRKLTIPSSLGYGARGAGAKIPPSSTLLFDVELLEIEK
jgi:FKBP-type peptidyl-prolyl cis-trans isomerase